MERIVARAGIASGSRVLDLAAGTGKLARRLGARGASCLAVEPSADMRRVFHRVLPGIPVLAATAEMVPLGSGSVDAVVVAQAFHWFDAPQALIECARVLRPRGWLALVWNERDESDPMVAELVRVTKWNRKAPYPMGTDFGEPIRQSGLFGAVDRTKFRFVQQLDRSGFVEQVATRSYVRVMEDADRQGLLGRVAEIAAKLEEPIAMPYITDLFCAQVMAQPAADPRRDPSP